MFQEIISVENLLAAWEEFLKGKRGKPDVQIFSLRLMDNIFSLHRELVNKIYRHGEYFAFKVNDPKPRDIHKASVHDRLLHHAVYRILYPYFDKKFIADSFSCRLNKGTHRALNRFRRFFLKVSKNNTKQCWVLKCDIRKFFASINHQTLKEILEKNLEDKDVLWLLSEIIGSFSSGTSSVGLPLGNLTSQILANVYMNEFDHFVKHRLKIKYYIRYADDFTIFSGDRDYLEGLINPIRKFLLEDLKLEFHEDKIYIKTIGSGVDFLGWVHFPDHRVLRAATKRRMFKKIEEHPTPETINSYLGLLKHGNTRKLGKCIYFKLISESVPSVFKI